MAGGTFAQRVFTRVVSLGQRTPFSATEQLAGPSGLETNPFHRSMVEAQRFDDFFEFFDGPYSPAWFKDKRLLDLGSGYGGRTVEFALRGARDVLGVEPFERMVEISNAYAASREATNCSFRVTTQADVPVIDESMDVVVSYDVLEHVDDPARTLREIHRALVPGGTALIVFTPYDGMFNHHLDYLTHLPGLHWVFSPRTVVNAVNAILADPAARESFGLDLDRQPEPRPSYNGTRRVLPTVNGLTSRGFFRLLDEQDWEVRQVRQTPVLEAALRRGWVHLDSRRAQRALLGTNQLLMRLGPWSRDAFSLNLAVALRKPSRGPGSD